MQEDGQIGWLGYKITKQTPFRGELVPVTISEAPPKCYIHVAQTVKLDHSGKFLLTVASAYSVRLEPRRDAPALIRYEYNRDSTNRFPRAHVHVAGKSKLLEVFNRRTGNNKKLSQLHLPVGGRRYRPTLEDLVELLIVEGFVNCRKGWQQVLEEHRQKFQRIQLMAAVRRDPAAAAEALRLIGWKVSPPEEE
jgi:hypothetical protein